MLSGVAPEFDQSAYEFTVTAGALNTSYGWQWLGNYSVTDADGGEMPMLSVSFSTNSLPPNVAGYFDVQSMGNSGTISFLQGWATLVGTTTITGSMTITDGDGNTDTADLILNIVNHAPTFSSDVYEFEIGEAELLASGGYLEFGSGITMTDADWDQTWGGSSGSNFFSAGGQGVVYSNGNNLPITPGLHTFTVGVTDLAGGFDIATVNINVTPRPNHDPVFTEEEYTYTVTLQDLMYSGYPLSGAMPYATDEDNDPITYTFYSESGDPFSVNTMMGNTVEYTGQPVSSGVYTYYVLAEDDRDGFDLATVTVNVIDPSATPESPNLPPTIYEDPFAPPQRVANPSGVVTISGYVTDDTPRGGRYVVEVKDNSGHLIADKIVSLDDAFQIELDIRGGPGTTVFTMEVVEIVYETRLVGNSISVETVLLTSTPDSPFLWNEAKKPGTNQPYSAAERTAIERAFMRKLARMRARGGFIGKVANEILRRMTLPKGHPDRITIEFKPGTEPYSKYGSSIGENIKFDPEDIANDFDRHFTATNEKGPENGDDRFAVVIVHEFGHSLGFRDPEPGTAGINLIWENLARRQVGFEPRISYNGFADPFLGVDIPNSDVAEFLQEYRSLRPLATHVKKLFSTYRDMRNWQPDASPLTTEQRDLLIAYDAFTP